MWIKQVFAVLVLLSPVANSAQVEPPKCRSYEPSVVGLRGTLVRKTFPEPPNYASIRKGDAAETYFLLDLDRPICVDEDKSQPDLNPSHKNIRKVRMVRCSERTRVTTHCRVAHIYKRTPND